MDSVFRITGSVWIGLLSIFALLLIWQHAVANRTNFDLILILLGLTLLLLIPGVALIKPDIQNLDTNLAKHDRLDRWLFWIALIISAVLTFMGLVE